MVVSNTEDLQSYVEAFDAGSDPAGPEWLSAYQGEAFARFRSTGLPVPGSEAWKYTNIRGLIDREFRPGESHASTLDAADLSSRSLLGATCPMAVFVNGVFNEDLSSLPGGEDGVVAVPLSVAIERNEDGLKEALSGAEAYEFESFADLNSSLFRTGVYIRVPEGFDGQAPIYLMYLSDCPDGVSMTHPRNVIHLEPGSKARVIEDYCGISDTAYLTNSFSQFQIDKNASCVHYRFVREGAGSFHISNTGINQADHSRFASHVFCFSGGVVRNEVAAILDGEGIECTLNGLTVGDGDEHVDNHTRIVHSKPNCNSWEMYKAVLADEAHGVFNGKIYVAQDAQKTDAKQSNQALLLSDQAVMDTKPELEIYADDVKCTHGATVGQLNEEGLFYLRSRGIGEKAAKVLLVYAFASDLVAEIEDPDLKAKVESILFEKLPGHCEPAGIPEGA